MDLKIKKNIGTKVNPSAIDKSQNSTPLGTPSAVKIVSKIIEEEIRMNARLRFTCKCRVSVCVEGWVEWILNLWNFHSAFIRT